MSWIQFFALISAVLGTARDGRIAPVKTLAHALAIFAELDRDHDGRLNAEEARKVGADRVSTTRELDVDADGRIDRDEFLLHYRTLLLRSGMQLAPELDDAVARARLRHRRSSVVPGEPAPPALSDRIEKRVIDGHRADAALRAAFEELERLALSGAPLRPAIERVRRVIRTQLTDEGVRRELVVDSALNALESDRLAGGLRTVVCLRDLRARLGIAPTAFAETPRSTAKLSIVDAAHPPPLHAATSHGLWSMRSSSLFDELERALDAGFVPEALARRVRTLVRSAPADRERAQLALDELIAAARRGDPMKVLLGELRTRVTQSENPPVH